jgi:glutamate-ammonia-ligase adenylyltransferase
MRTTIRENISSRDRSFNIKLMEGGIRDIEFILQTLQLIHGHKSPSLRVPNTLEGIRRVYHHKLIKKTEMETMTRAYVFFRLVEHRLQMMHQIKTHSIPESSEEIELLARRVSQGPLGTFTIDSFLSSLATHLNKIRLLSDSFFAGEGMPETPLLALVPGDEDLARETLSQYGFEDTKQAFSILQTLAYGSFPNLVDRPTRASFQRYLSPLLEGCSKTGDPNLTLVNFSRLAQAGKNMSALYRLLADVPTAHLLIRNLTGISAVLTNKLCKNPEILDPLIEDPDHLLAVGVDELESLARFADNPGGENRERLRSDLRTTLDRRFLAAWVLDNRNGSFPRAMSNTLTVTARDLISAVFDGLIKNEHAVALLALGSYGVGEPRLTSDVDLLVVTDGVDIEPITKSIQTLNQLFSDGGLLKIDFRLRGEGANAPLVQDLETYRRYFERRMAPWERVAFTKCAHWCGSSRVAGAFCNSLAGTLGTPVTKERYRTLADTRRQLEELSLKGGGLFETKRSAGGRYDIEYMTAMGLAHSGAAFALDATTEERLETLVEAGIIDAEDLSALMTALYVYHCVEFLIEFQGFSLPNSREREKYCARYLDRSFDLLGITIGGRVEETLVKSKKIVRDIYKRPYPISFSSRLRMFLSFFTLVIFPPRLSWISNESIARLASVDILARWIVSPSSESTRVIPKRSPGWSAAKMSRIVTSGEVSLSNWTRNGTGIEVRFLRFHLTRYFESVEWISSFPLRIS